MDYIENFIFHPDICDESNSMPPGYINKTSTGFQKSIKGEYKTPDDEEDDISVQFPEYMNQLIKRQMTDRYKLADMLDIGAESLKKRLNCSKRFIAKRDLLIAICLLLYANETGINAAIRKVNPEKAKAISLKDLEERGWKDIRAKAAVAKEILEREEKAVEEDPLDARIKILRDEMFNRFTEYSDGKITKDEFVRFQNRAKVMVTDMEQRRDAEIERKEYLERRQEVLGPLVRTLELPELTRDVLTAVVDKIYWYDGVLEVLVKGEEFLCDDEPESLVNID